MWVSRRHYEQLVREHESLMGLKETLDKTIVQGRQVYNALMEDFTSALRVCSSSDGYRFFMESLESLSDDVLVRKGQILVSDVIMLTYSLSGMITDFKLSPVGDLNHRLIHHLLDPARGISKVVGLDSATPNRGILLEALGSLYSVCYAILSVRDGLLALYPSYRMFLVMVERLLIFLKDMKSGMA